MNIAMAPPSQKNREMEGKSLRSRAEQRLRCRPHQMMARATEAQMKSVIHELEVHQIELEMQNDQLQVSQQELERAKESYTELYDFAPVGYVTVSKKGVIEESNLTLARLLGVERSRLIGKLFSQFVDRLDQETYYRCWRKIFQGSSSQVCEIRLTPASGRAFFSRLEAVQAIRAEKDVCRMAISDITEQKRFEASLRESERRRLQYESEEWKRLALEAADLGAWDQDLQTGKCHCSERACAMLGYRSETTITWQAFLLRIHPEDRPRFLAEIEKSTNPTGPRLCETVFRIVPPKGRERWVRFVARTLFGAELPARPVRRTGILADITPMKEAEELLASRAKHLESLVRERTMRLEEAVGELEHFSYTLAHDLRAPLRSIAGFSGLLLQTCNQLTPTQRNMLERSGAAVRRMDQLIIDALNYNKIVRHNLPLEPVDSGALLQELLETYPQFHEARKCISVDGAIPMVLGNNALLTQCFSNLLTNALKFVPKERVPKVRIFTEVVSNRVRLWFQDNGIGIPEESHEMVFKMFHRLNRDFEGTGIGLALVKKAVERMGGAVGFESHPGQGSRFWLELQRA